MGRGDRFEILKWEKKALQKHVDGIKLWIDCSEAHERIGYGYEYEYKWFG